MEAIGPMSKPTSQPTKNPPEERAVPVISGSRNLSVLTRRGVLGAIAAAPFVLRSGRALAEEPLSLRVDFAPWGVQSALHLAMAKGWFKDDGLNVDLQDGTGSLNTINLVAAGNVDVGLVQLGLLAIARSKGLPVTSFAGFMRKGDLATLVDAKSGPKTAKELAGKKIVCFAASPWAPFIDVYLKRIGLERGEGPDKVNVVMVSPAAMVSTYASGGADGFMSLKEFGEPYVEQARPAHSILAVDVGIAFPSYGLIVSDETLGKRKDLLARLVANQSRAWQYLFADPAHIDEGARAIMANRADKQLNFDVLRGQTALCKEFIDTENTKGKPLGWQSPDDWKKTLAMMAEAGQAKADANINDFFTNDLLKS
jgi:NitT/TauT family transport system substrate-binding protein